MGGVALRGIVWKTRKEEMNGLEFKMMRGLVHSKPELNMRGWAGVSMKCTWSLARAGCSIHD